MLQCIEKVGGIPSKICQKLSQMPSKQAAETQVGKVPTKLVIQNLWEVLCVDLNL
jgi:hypothetical protein